MKRLPRSRVCHTSFPKTRRTGETVAIWALETCSKCMTGAVSWCSLHSRRHNGTWQRHRVCVRLKTIIKDRWSRPGEEDEGNYARQGRIKDARNGRLFLVTVATACLCSNATFELRLFSNKLTRKQKFRWCEYVFEKTNVVWRHRFCEKRVEELCVFYLETA